MTTALALSYASGSLTEAVNEAGDEIAKAATATIEAAAQEVVRQAESDVAAAGFSLKWQKSFHYKMYPDGGAPSYDAAAEIYSKIPYSEVFETGATIRGRPLLWIPTHNAPMANGFARHTMTPKEYIAGGGHLYSANRPGKPPMLVGTRRPAAKGTRVPLYIGIDAVKIDKQFHVYEIADAEANRLPELFDEHLKD